LKLEFFQGGLARAVILLYAGSTAEVDALRREVRSLADSRLSRVTIDGLPFVEAIGGCSLVAVTSNIDVGVQQADGRPIFRWTLRSDSWDNVEWLLEPFSALSAGQERFQYLNPAAGPEVIYSTDRGW
jgi:hypothetical protein